MHMLLTSLSATIYQSQIPILQYGQRHVDQMSIMHLRYVITGEVTPWIGNLITYITDPLIMRTRNHILNHTTPGAQNCPNKNKYGKPKKEGKHNISYKRHHHPPYPP